MIKLCFDGMITCYRTGLSLTYDAVIFIQFVKKKRLLKILVMLGSVSRFSTTSAEISIVRSN